MANLQELKFKKFGFSSEVAKALVDNGLTTPKKVKEVSAQELEDAVGSENVSAIEAKFNISRE